MTPEELKAAKERANLKRRVRRLWAGDSSFVEICEEVGMNEQELRAFASEMGMGTREEPDCYLPTPAEIRMAAASIRANWTQAERESRLEAARSATMKDTYGYNDARRSQTRHRSEGSPPDGEAGR